MGKVHELRRDDPPEYRRRIDELTDLASSFAGALRAATAAEVVSCAAPYARAMGALGDAAGAPIIESRLRLALDLAARFSGSAKPCGAGGGDVAIAFFADPGAANAFELACEDEGLHPIDVSWGAEGVKAR